MADESTSNSISWKNVHETQTKCSVSHFFESVQVWIDKPHVVNRRLSGSLVVKHAFVSHGNMDKLYELTYNQRSISTLSSVVEELSIPTSQKRGR
jgi:hypothetical protein